MIAESSAVDRSYRISSVEKACDVLNAFAAPPYRFTLTEIAAASGQSANQAFRVLQTLLATGFVRQETESKSYRLGARLFTLIPALTLGDELLTAGRDALDTLYHQVGLTVSLIVLDDESATICLDCRECGQSTAVSGAVGSRSTYLHAGAAGKLLLSSLPDVSIERYIAANVPLHRFTESTSVEPGELWDELREIRRQGYAVSLGEVAAEMYGMAAPVRNRRGEIAGAVALAAPFARADAEAREQQLAAVIETARRISINLGYRAVVALG